MTSAFQVRTVQQAAPKFDVAQWTGTPDSQAEVSALLLGIAQPNRPATIIVSVGGEGELDFSADYYHFVVPLNDYLVTGPYFGGELWGAPSKGHRPYESVNPALFANRFPTE